ncbi:MAG: Spo0E family sporulation regulatory protein-aspartic acid phosphatase [Lachnospiraceae bacterium]
MGKAKEELVREIETSRQKLNNSIESRQDANVIYQYSVELDKLIEQYIVLGY